MKIQAFLFPVRFSPIFCSFKYIRQLLGFYTIALSLVMVHILSSRKNNNLNLPFHFSECIVLNAQVSQVHTLFGLFSHFDLMRLFKTKSEPGVYNFNPGLYDVFYLHGPTRIIHVKFGKFWLNNFSGEGL